jgi:hexosaminidase
MRNFLLLLIICFSIDAAAQQLNIIPKPVSVEAGVAGQFFKVNPATVIVLEGTGLENCAGFLNDYLNEFFKIKLKVVKTSTSSNAIRLNYERLDGKLPGAYEITINGKGIYIAGDNDAGVFYGVQTVLQLLPVEFTKDIQLPYLAIKDEPRFEYRGMHLDVCRHFFSVAFVKRYIDFLAYHKFNTFHWHLTDDQGWRIEIKKYPRLISVGAMRNGTIKGRYPGTGNDNEMYSGFYTQAQVRDVVQYASRRFITVIPEIEMPGHSSAAIAAYPYLSCFPEKPTAIPANMISTKSIDEQKNGRVKLVQETWGVFDDVFCAGNDSTFNFLENVLDEVIKLFPSKYLHVGGDESPKTHWKICPKCQARIKSLGLKDEHELQSYFIRRIEKYLNAKGKTLIGWDEILEGGIAPKAVVMSWRGEQGGIDAAKQHHQVIMTPGNPVYFDHTQSLAEDSVTIGGYNPMEKVYAYDPVPKELTSEESAYILGAQANLWTEYIAYPSKVEYMIFPRMAALSEVLWSGKEKRNWEDFEKRLPSEFERYKLWRANYSLAYYDISPKVLPSSTGNGVLWKLETKRPNTIINYRKTLTIDDPPNPPAMSGYSEPIMINRSGEYSAWVVENGTPLPNRVTANFLINKATGKKITLANMPSAKYPGDGAFTLVNGIQNTKGLARTKEFIAFEGTDCEAIIDFGSETEINEVVIHTLEQEPSWIHFPGSFDLAGSADGNSFSPLSSPVTILKSADHNSASLKLASPVKVRYLKVLVRNAGLIPDGKAGAGNKAWLFLSEIEVN